MTTIKTRWYAQAKSGLTLMEYPRPQLERADWLCLNGKYEYAVTSISSDFPRSYEGEILVPFAVETALSGVERPLNPEDRLWYRRSFTVPESWRSKQVLLHFGAVDWKCEVYVNRKLVADHVGGYCPFSCNISRALKEGENELVLRVYDPTDRGWQQRGKQVLEPGGIWYTATSGIWQTVWLEPVDACHLTSLRLLPDLERSVLKVETKFSIDTNLRIMATVCSRGREIMRGSIGCGEAEIPIPDAIYWRPENPHLYDLQLDVTRDGHLCDSVQSYFGMRSFGIGKDETGLPRLLLNGQPYFQRGLLDQGYWPESGMTPPSDEAMIYDIQTIKDLGFNMLRKHIKLEPLRWYYHCDRIGVIVWQDMMSGGAPIGLVRGAALPNLNVSLKDDDYKSFSRAKPEWRADFKRELFELLETLYNCVCIGCWVPFNEGWGQFDAAEIAKAVKTFDPSRVVDHASGWHDQGGIDLKSVHKYVAPVRLPKPDGRPFALTEFGGYSQVPEGHAWNQRKSFGYRMFKDKAELTANYKRLLEKQIIPLIPKGLCATIYTQLSDVEVEVNGLLSYDRELTKLQESTVKKLNDRMVL